MDFNVEARAMPVTTLGQDLRFAARTMIRNPGATVAAALTLALGIGANSAMFSLVHGVVLRPLPYPAEERLVEAWMQAPGAGIARLPLADAELLHFQRFVRGFDGLAGFITGEVNLTGGDSAERVSVARVSASLFPILGATAEIGRVFTPSEDSPGHDPVAVLSHDLWQRRFGGDRTVVGRTIRIDGSPYTVVGALPTGFHFPGPATALWLPIALDPAKVNPANHQFNVVGRLAPGSSIRHVEAESQGIARSLSKIYPNAYPADQLEKAGFGMQLMPLHDYVVGEARPALLLLLGAVGLVLLIACANVANLQLARAEGRRYEIGVRTAMGCRRGRLVRQLMTENALLGLLGAAGGIVVALGAIKVLRLMHPPNIPRLDEVGLDLATFAFALAAGLATALLFGLVPALQAAKGGVADSIRHGARGTRARAESAKLGRLLVVAELALASCLLIAAGLLIRSLTRLHQVDPGFSGTRVLTSSIDLPASDYPDRPAVGRFHERLIEQLAAAGGAESSAFVNTLPLSGTMAATAFDIEGRSARPGDSAPRNAQFRVVTPGFFSTLRIDLHAGRAFTAADDDRREGVAIIDQMMAKEFWGNEDPLGKRVRAPSASGRWLTVVGVVSPVRYEDLRRLPLPTIYLAEAQMAYSPALGGWRSMDLLVRTRGNPEHWAKLVRSRIAALDKNLPVPSVATMESVLARSAAQPLFTTVLLSAFAGLALLLAAVGIYGVVSYITVRRTHEIGIRMAIGASRTDILHLVVGNAISMAALGVCLGIAAAVLVKHLLASLLFGISSTDLPTFAGVTLLLLAIAWLAAFLPAWKASRIAPAEALSAQ
jgi:putative ABC transport system permease protein